MNWKELIETLAEGRSVKLISTATTGLSGDDDELLAVSVLNPEDVGSVIHTYFKRVDDRDKVLKSQPYHKITPEMSMEGRTEEDFVNVVNEELDNSIVFTYNPSFHSKFLAKQGIETRLYSLPLFLKGAEMRMVLFDDEAGSINALEETFTRKAGAVKKFNKLTAELGLSPVSLELPLQFSCRALLALWKRLVEIPALVQGTLL